MSERPDPRLLRLKQVTDLAAEVARRRLAERIAAERAAEAEIAALDARREDAMADLAGADQPDQARILATARWLRWARAERARLNRALAAARAESLADREAAARAFGRDQALARLLHRRR